MAGASRIVIDLARPARIEKALVVDSANNQPARLVLELAAVERDAFLRTVVLENRAPEPRNLPEDGQGKPESDSRPLVVIDHQGRQSLDAAAYFTGHGLQNVRCLRGGIDAWAQEVDGNMRRYRLG